jgi:hypothetical protein
MLHFLWKENMLTVWKQDNDSDLINTLLQSNAAETINIKSSYSVKNSSCSLCGMEPGSVMVQLIHVNSVCWLTQLTWGMHVMPYQHRFTFGGSCDRYDCSKPAWKAVNSSSSDISSRGIHYPCNYRWAPNMTREHLDIPKRTSDVMNEESLVRNALLKDSAFWNRKPWIPLKGNRGFGGTRRLHLRGERKPSKKPAWITKKNSVA